MVDFIDDYKNYEYEGGIDSPPSKKSRCGIVRAYKGGDFNEALEKNLREINSKSRIMKKILSWAFYKPYEEYEKEADLKC